MTTTLSLADLPDGAPVWLVALVALILAVGGVSGLIALLNQPKTARKIDADTAEVLTGAAVALVAPLREQVDALTRRVNAWEVRDRMHKQILGDHKQWDDLARAVAAEAGMDLPKPPPLTPPPLVDLTA